MQPTEPQRILVTGATGFVGRATSLRLAREGHTVVAWVRDPDRARATLGAGPELVAAGDRASLAREVGRADLVLHLAGEPLFAGRWTAARRRSLVASRVDLTRDLAAAIAAAPRRPRALVAASAVGFYGDRGDESLDERSEGGAGFLAELCRDWERACDAASSAGVRVVHARIGVVLGPGGGALARMLPPFRLGLGGRLGDGRQWLSWIHLDDLVEMLRAALLDPAWRGPVDATAPQPVTNAGFTRALGRALRRPAVVPVPAAALRLALGGAAEVLLASQRVSPRRARELGFVFRHPTIDAALADLVGGSRADCAVGPVGERPASRYLAARPARYELFQRTVIPAPLEEVFAFFSRAENLGAVTPPEMRFSILSPRPIAMGEGATIDYRIRLGPFAMRWRTEIERWEPGRSFVDTQVEGPYRAWWHEHRFRREGDATVMEDRVLYAPPLGVLGRLANAAFVAPKLRAIFGYRTSAIRWRFGEAGIPRRGAREGIRVAARG